LPIAMAENLVNRKALRHIDTRRHYIGLLVEDNTIVWAPCAARCVSDGDERERMSEMT
jgi:hypothetical protein